MTISVSPGEGDVQAAMRSFMLAILPPGVEVVLGQDNRVPEPAGGDFVVFTPTRRSRLSTNVDEFVDARFVAAIAGTVMTVTEMDYGTLKVGSVLFGVGLSTSPPTQITALGTGTGGTGSYVISPSQTVASEVMAAGVLNALAPVDVVIQIDVHGPSSEDNAHRIFAMLRDDYAVQKFSSTPGVTPLYADDPKQIPFVSGEDQYEDRWVVEAHVQANATVNDIPQQFFEQIVVKFIPVDIEYIA